LKLDEKIMPERGDMISDETMYKSMYGSVPGTKEILDRWYDANKKVVDDFFRFIVNNDGASDTIISQISKKALGWTVPVGSEIHDLLIPEFGWEYLPYKK
jgi:hypothetical protein